MADANNNVNNGPDSKEEPGTPQGGKYQKKSGWNNGRKRNPKKYTPGKEVPSRNDYTFYAASEQIAADIASIPWNYISGTKYPLEAEQVVGEATTPITKKQALKSIGIIEYDNSIGITNQNTEGVNMAAVQLYTFIRHANSGARNYEAADVMMYVLQMREIYAEYFECKRILGAAQLYNYYNHNFPDMILRALGMDPVDVRSNIAQYRGDLNILAKKINSFAVPKYFKAFDRSAFICSYLFSDSSSVRGQFYAFKKKGYYTWSGTTSEKGTELVYHLHTDTPDTPTKFSVKIANLQAMLDSIFLDEDALTMSGDILKAFKDSELYGVSETNTDYVLSYVFDEDILAQIENARFISDYGSYVQSFSFSNMNITQQNQLIKFNPVYTEMLDPALFTRAINLTRVMLNSHKDQPDYRDVLEWTRLMATTKKTTSASGEYFYITNTITSCGLELPWRLLIFNYYEDPQGNWVPTYTRVSTVMDCANAGVLSATQFDVLGRIAQMDWHPAIYIFKEGVDAPIGLSADVKVATTLDIETLRKINQAAVYGAFFAKDMYNHTHKE